MITRTAVFFFIILLSTLFCASFASAWDVSYEGDALPYSSELGEMKWSTPMTAGFHWSSSDGDLLHLVDRADESFPQGLPAYCYREGSYLPAGTPATVEARVKVLAANPGNDWDCALGFGVATSVCNATLGLWPDKVGMRWQNQERMVFVPVDLTQFHTFRIAVTGDYYSRFRVWMDGQPIFSGIADSGSLHGVYFGSTMFSPLATSDSYWDYVRYSKSYEPVPEPAAVMGLGMGLVPLAGALARRRKRK